MERNAAVRKPHTSTADLLTWKVSPPSATPPSASSHRPHQPSDNISKVLFGGQVSQEEAESLMKKKPCSGYKLNEMSGSSIFNGQDGESESGGANPNNRTTVRVYQQAVTGMSQISFSSDESISLKKPTSIPEVAKQRELSGTMQNDADMKSKRQISNAKFKEISGHDIFSPPDEIVPRSLAVAHSLEIKENKDIGEPAPRNIHPSIKVSNPAGGQSNILFGEEPVMKTAKKILDQKFHELTGNDIFKGDVPPGSAEKPLSTAKLKEMSGSDIFADGKAASRDYLGGVRKPPGGESSIALV
ncbi:hypothetical protein POPTR_005G076000v4 [Populus trichocarpa]|uniref:DUF4057 domain-containing protein n=1 Tax=Populus trichocarpa TaxID=3694 RepID=B9H530_POPTR|nr:uncharacterized protein LOC7477089 [Populus trichocarpa]PNT35437.1 hypothetical protein POPTR_005G076000v4 [Populus trichocarpa]|eukprot:XP_002307088.2 uncharacterized protein LOC7477089 [Populus trichocarpa]